MWRHLPNLISILRLLLVLPVFRLIESQRYAEALGLAALAGASDAVDGFLAKRYGWQSRLGGMLDPLADKMLLLACFAGLVLVDALPLWLLVLVVGRDLVIVAGAVAYHNLVGPFDAAPTLLSKATTAVQIACVLVVLLGLAWLPGLPGIDVLFVLTAVITLASGLHYVVVWSLRAVRTVRARNGEPPR
ncbi:CDP-alcohol phosphatidyltransferase family protein [Dokdonella sp.]|uniref:CDP-alcohol phosphatidyltransferase family protein n=1 Tax=Dokdonella sp. TaxID=2291710 RepID=UPI0025BD62A3|nr:CDP-alcohol phosphatidyltransferase family protein [Dokdonella sp.]MBX3693002.1 CDP-alcohol phosphatidyltransferase family protein [Dokdonella sp.]MCW5568913.1 CDP-alcohol phosphatidyltransferase family protein [Dokdonella sp.]